MAKAGRTRANTRRADVAWPVVVSLPIRLVSEANARGTWARAKRTATARREVLTALLAESAPPEVGVRLAVVITRIGTRPLDDDNLASACKATRDAVAEWLQRDDGDGSVAWYTRQQRGQYGVRVLVRLRDERDDTVDAAMRAATEAA